MVYPRSLRGDINAILNRLVSDGAIKGFSTNLFEKPVPEQPLATIAVHRREDAEVAYRKVTQALEPLSQHIIVSVDLPDTINRDGENRS